MRSSSNNSARDHKKNRSKPSTDSLDETQLNVMKQMKNDFYEMKPFERLNYFIVSLFCRGKRENRTYKKVLNKANTRLNKELDLRKFVLR